MTRLDRTARATRRAVGLLTLTGLLAVSACSSSHTTERNALATGSNDRVDPVGFRSFEIASANGSAATPTSAATSSTVAHLELPTEPSTTAQTELPTTAPAQAPAPTETPPISVAATAPGATAASRPTPTRAPQPVLAAPLVVATRATSRATTPAPPAAANATSESVGPSTTAVTATAAVVIKPKVGATCTKSQQTGSTTRADGSVVSCVRKNGKRAWVLLTGASAGNTPLPAGIPARTAGFDGQTIKIGILSTTTHPVWGTIGKALKAGLEARVATVNRRGGIAGRYKIEMVFADTNYDPAQTITQLNLTKDSVTAYAQILGTPNVEAVEPLLRQFQLVASPASQEARWALSPDLMPIGNSYQVQAINGISYFLEQSALNNPDATPRICAASVATSYGDAGNEGFAFARERLGFDAGPMVSIGPAETSMAAYSLQLRNAGCAAVMVTVGPAQTLGLVVSGRQQGFSPRWIIMGASFSDKIVVPQTGPLFEQGAWVVGDGTEWGDPSVSGMATMRNELIASDNRFWTENPDVGLTYGYVQGLVIEALLERAVALGDLSRAGILAASRKIGAVDTLGLMSPIDYSQPTRLANARTTIFAVDGSYLNAIKVLSRDYTSPTALAYRK
jgi:Periplasmic binding protein